MKHQRLLFTVLIVFFFNLSFGQKKNKINFLKEPYSIKISDNVNKQYQSNDYHFWSDSLTISGLSDFGRSHVQYLNRKLDKEERRKIAMYISEMHADSLDTMYFDQFSSFGYISADHFPRVITLEVRWKGKVTSTKITNCYVRRAAGLFDFLDQFLPKEVMILYRENDFKASH